MLVLQPQKVPEGSSEDLTFKIQDSRFKIQDSRFKIQVFQNDCLNLSPHAMRTPKRFGFTISGEIVSVQLTSHYMYIFSVMVQVVHNPSRQITRLRLQDSRFKIQDSRFKIKDTRYKNQDSRFKIQDSRFKISREISHVI